MVHSTPGPDVGLPEFLAARARHATDARLALNAGGGLLVAGGALWWRPPGWPLLACAAACFLAYGVWGIADRELGEPGLRPVPAAALRVVRALAGGVGALAVLLLLFGVVALGLGTWIS